MKDCPIPIPDLVALTADARLPAEARIVAQYVMLLGEGWHEVPHDQLRSILPGGPSDSTIGRLVRALLGTGWLERRPGGRGHAPRYRFIARHECGAIGSFRDALVASFPASVVSGDDLSGDSRSAVTTYPSIGRQGRRAKGGRGVESSKKEEIPPSMSPPSEPDEAGGPEAEDGEGATHDPSHIRRPERQDPVLTEGAAKLIESRGDVLNGCSDILSEYLSVRVRPESQRAYIYSVLNLIEGGDETAWRRRNGTAVAQEDRSKVLAQALSELGTADEQKERKWQPGDFSNLRNKLGAILRFEDRPSSSGRGGGSRRKKKSTSIDEMWGRES